MRRRHTYETKTKCKVCGKSIKQVSPKAKGFCNDCKCNIMRRWSNVPFEIRYKLLLYLGGQSDELLN